MEKKEKRGSFTSSLGFVLAAAGSAVGLGNIWRFPYLAAKDGGGVFLLFYLVLALTFGFTLLTTEIAIGRKTGQSALTAYRALHPKMGWIGVVACIIPVLILPYYCVIGGWVLKYLSVYITGGGMAAVESSYFDSFITAQWEPIIWFVVYIAATCFIVYKGVDKGIERLSKILMPILLLLIIGIAVYALTLSHTDESGVTRTGLQGAAVYLIPDFSGMTLKQFFVVLTDAMGQLFYSISVAMGIMVAYGSYVPDESNMVRSVNMIEIFDTLVAFLAGVMIIPAIYVFQGVEGMKGGPSLMFVALPKVFAEMGSVGRIIGTMFFAMVLFAAVTSAVSIMEAVVSSMLDGFHWSRKRATITEGILAMILCVIVCLGYNVLYFEKKLPNGSTAQILDIMDYLSNYLLMPVIAIGTCILIGWVIGPDAILSEATKNGERMGRRTLYVVMTKYVAPVLLIFLLLIALGIIHLE